MTASVIYYCVNNTFGTTRGCLLYRMQFKDIIGHNQAIDTIRDMVDSEHVPHAILFSGMPGIGKMRLARAFIQYINCQNPHNGDSCGVCPACRRIQNFSEPDIHYIFPIKKNQKAKIFVSDDLLDIWIKMLNEFSYMPTHEWLRLIEAGNTQPAIYVNESEHIAQIAALSSYSSKYKIFLIWLPEKLGAEAANKLLKLIEEPFEDTLFIAVSNDPQAILPTVLSRMRHIELRRPDNKTLLNALIKAGVSDSEAHRITALANGNIQRALEMSALSGESVEFGDAFRNAMRNAYACNVDNLRTTAERFNDLGREKSVRLLNYFANMVRENFIANLRMPALNTMNTEEDAFSQRFAPFIHEANVEQIIDEIDAAARDITRNANGKLVWFDFLLRLMSLIRIKRSI